MKRKAFTLTLAAFLLASLAACSNGTNSSKTANETTSAVETSVSENAHSDIIRICQDFLQNNETDETLASILDMDTPDVQEMKIRRQKTSTPHWRKNREPVPIMRSPFPQRKIVCSVRSFSM